MSAKERNALHKIISNGTPTEINLKLEENIFLLKSTFGKQKLSALHISIYKRDSDCLQVVKCLIEKGINCNSVDIHGNTALLLAAKLNKFEVACYLTTQCDVTVQNNYGLNIVHMLASRGGLNAVLANLETILNCNQDIRIKDLINQKTCLKMSYKKVFDNIQAGKGNTMTVRGWSPLHFASISCDFDSVTWLINYGADVNITNGDKVTARELLLEYNNKMTCHKYENSSRKIQGKLIVGRPIKLPETLSVTPRAESTPTNEDLDDSNSDDGKVTNDFDYLLVTPRAESTPKNEDLDLESNSDDGEVTYDSDYYYSDDFESDDSFNTVMSRETCNCEKGIQFNGNADLEVQTNMSTPATSARNNWTTEHAERGVQTSRQSNRCSTPADRVRTPADGGEVNDNQPTGNFIRPATLSHSMVHLEVSEMTQYPSDTDLADIARKISPTDYKFFGIYLGIEAHTVEGLSVSKASTIERTLDLLLHWRNGTRLTDDDKYEKLIEALRKIDKNNIVKEFFKDRGHTPKVESRF